MPENGLLITVKVFFLFEPHLKPWILGCLATKCWMIRSDNWQVFRAGYRIKGKQFNAEDQRLTSKTGFFPLLLGAGRVGIPCRIWQMIEPGSIRNQQQCVTMLSDPNTQATGNMFPGGAFMFVPNLSCIFAESGSRNRFFQPGLLFLGFFFFFKPDPKRHHVLFKN